MLQGLTAKVAPGRRPTGPFWILAAVLPAASGCVTLAHPRGSWAEPVVVPLPPEPLSGVVVGIECGAGDLENPGAPWHPAVFDGCRDLASLVKKMGGTPSGAPGLMPKAKPGEAAEAEEKDEEPPKPQFTLRYLDYGGSSDYCGWTLPLFILSITLFPCVEDIDSRAALQVVAQSGGVFHTYPLQIQVESIYGPAALYYLAVHVLGYPEPEAVRQRRYSRRLQRYLQSVIYTYRIRQEVQTALSQLGGERA